MDLRKKLMYADIALTVAKYGTCNRLQVGSVIVKNDCIIGTGFNGSARGEIHCKDFGCELVHGHCVRCVHSETNALLNASRNGASTVDSTIIITHRPCPACLRNLINAGIAEVVYVWKYGKPVQRHLARLIKITRLTDKQISIIGRTE